jgi:hypothetical protein
MAQTRNICDKRQNNTVYSIENTDSQTNKKISYQQMIQSLFDICITDTKCRKIYHQDYRKNITVFKYLLNSDIFMPAIVNQNPLEKRSSSSITKKTEFSIDYPVDSVLCDSSNEESEINRKLWLLFMNSMASSESIMCDVNHVLSVDEHNLRTICICRPDRTCSDQLYDLVLFYVLLILVGVLTSAFLIANIYSVYVSLRNTEKSEKSRKNGVGVLYSVVR